MSHHLETVQRLRQKGYRLTPQRLAVLEAIKAGPGHMSVNDVLAHVQAQYPTLTVPTVYRILQWLKGVNLVAETDLGAGCHIYEYIADHHHHHLVCTQCNKIIDYTDFIDDEVELLNQTEKGLGQKYKFKITNHLIQFYGVCEKCNGKAYKEPKGIPIQDKKELLHLYSERFSLG